MCILCQMATAGASVVLSVVPSVSLTSSPSPQDMQKAPNAQVTSAPCKKPGAVRTVKKQVQTCSKVGKKLVWVAARKSSATTVPQPKLSAPPTMPAGGADHAACQLREARVNKYQPWNIGFPRGTNLGPTVLPSSGRVNVQLLAIDFPGAAGTSAELVAAEKEIAEYNRWFELTSKGSLSFNWQFPKQWLRMSKPAAEYNLKKGDRATVLPMAQEVVSLGDPLVDYTDSKFVFVLFPRTIKLGVSDLGMHNWRVETNEGPVENLFGGSEYFYDRGFELWSFWIHEWGHPMGLAGHAPRSHISIMDNQNGSSVVLNVWDSFFSGWLGSDELYCMPIEEKSKEITLIPLERFQRGPRGVIVPITDTNALVIESHRAEGWGKRMMDANYVRQFGTDGGASYGVSVYWVDTASDTNRWVGTNGFYDSDLGEKWADHVVPAGVKRPFDLLIKGDTVTYKGVTVSFVKTGDYDTVRITK
jgi:hypothetical protein